jgi:hypothetical protein
MRERERESHIKKHHPVIEPTILLGLLLQSQIRLINVPTNYVIGPLHKRLDSPMQPYESKHAPTIWALSSWNTSLCVTRDIPTLISRFQSAPITDVGLNLANSPLTHQSLWNCSTHRSIPPTMTSHREYTQDLHPDTFAKIYELSRLLSQLQVHLISVSNPCASWDCCTIVSDYIYEIPSYLYVKRSMWINYTYYLKSSIYH